MCDGFFVGLLVGWLVEIQYDTQILFACCLLFVVAMRERDLFNQNKAKQEEEEEEEDGGMELFESQRT